MNQNLRKAIFDMEKVDALMHSVEDGLTIDVMPEERERADRAAYLFYALWDVIHQVKDDLEKISGDCLVVDAIYAVNDVRRQARTLESED